ncbi:hypothetical protein WECO103172_06395 [Weissella confusa]
MLPFYGWQTAFNIVLEFLNMIYVLVAGDIFACETGYKN